MTLVRAASLPVSNGGLAAAREACARDVLARTTGTARDEWRLDHSGDGRPVATHAACGGVSLSVTHTKTIVACAASETGTVGLDVEEIQPLDDLDAMRRQAFEPALNARLDALPAEKRLHVFFDMWVAFEALGKVTGRGIVDWRCPDLDAAHDAHELARLCGVEDAVYLWRGRRGSLAWAVAVATPGGRPVLAWRWR
jgi:phosphopantetheinyl transferase